MTRLTVLVVAALLAPAGAATAPGPALPAAVPTAARDTKPPTAPGSLRATPARTAVTLTWAASRDNVEVAYYVVALAGRVKKPTGTRAWFGRLRPDTVYTATVRAVDRAGNRSTAARVSFRTLRATRDTQPPTPPTDLRATPEATAVDLTWAPATDNIAVTSYAVSVAGQTLTVTDPRASVTGLAAATAYTAVVAAKDAAGNVSAAASVDFTTLPDPDARSIYVSPTGSDDAPGTAAAPLRTIQAAVDRAGPGTVIKLSAGTHTAASSIRLDVSGTAQEPITIQPAGDGPVTVTHPVSTAACDSLKPAYDRTFTIPLGTDHWVIEGLRIENGIWVAGRGANPAFAWLTDLVNSGDWQTRRRAPGHGSLDPAAARTELVPFLRAATGQSTLDPAEGITIRDNTITGRGIYGALTSYGQITGNTIRDIACGTGPGIWLMTFSNGWLIDGNTIFDIAASTGAHYMQEGIRIGSAANYNEIRNNHVHDLPGDGRAINTDVDSSWNYLHHNRADTVAIGYNDQMSSWGNRWEHNTVAGYRSYGMAFRLKDASLTEPSYATSANRSVVRCNIASNAVGAAPALGVGASMGATFAGNDLPRLFLSPNLKAYWTAAGNTWNGSSAVPPDAPLHDPTGC